MLPSTRFRCRQPRRLFGNKRLPRRCVLGFSLAASDLTGNLAKGYDVVSITTANFNSTQRQSWTVPWQSEVNFACEPHQFQLGDSFRTNVSAFSYSIFEVQSSDASGGTSDIQGGFFYENNDLSSCDIVQYEIEVRPGDRLITSTVRLFKSLAGQLGKKNTGDD